MRDSVGKAPRSLGKVHVPIYKLLQQSAHVHIMARNIWTVIVSIVHQINLQNWSKYANVAISQIHHISLVISLTLVQSLQNEPAIPESAIY